MTEIERYRPKELQNLSSTAIPLSPILLLETSRLSKENEELRIKITDLETQLEKLADTEAILHYLETFKKHFEFHCLVKNHTVTIMLCANTISMGLCSMKNVCRGRLALGKKLKYL